MTLLVVDSNGKVEVKKGHSHTPNIKSLGKMDAYGTEKNEDNISISKETEPPYVAGTSPPLGESSNTEAQISGGGGTIHDLPPEPIAIVGMAMRLPGGVNSSEKLWDFLSKKMDARREVPGDRYNVKAFYDSCGRPGSVGTQHGYFLQDNIGHLDAAFFSMTQAEIAALDPQQRLLLEVVWECMENAGQTDWKGSDIGCYVGVFGEDWLDISNKDAHDSASYQITGSGDFMISNRISYEYNLKGPSMTIRTGCSSALVGFHEACQAIYTGECTSALVCGTNLIITPTMSITMRDEGVLSPTGSCKTFDAAADGYARGEAINAVYIKKLSDAVRDNDPIRAIIRSTTVNCDGKTQGVSTPSSEAHERMIRRAYRVAQIHDISKTGFVECHGTGTAVGDPLETAAIANVFGEKGILIGSVKPNFGHSEGASGITSLIKSVLCLENKQIPPNIHLSVPNPKIPFEKAKLQVPLELIPWPKDRLERVSINSFGFGGSNAHVIVDSASHLHTESTIDEAEMLDSAPKLLVFSANSKESLQRKIAELQKYVGSAPQEPGDLAYTLGLRREHLKYRAFSTVNDNLAFEASKLQKARSIPPNLTFVFTGQGAQWAGMGRDLLVIYKSFRDDIRAMDRVLQGLKHFPSWSIEEELSKVGTASRIDEAEFSQPLCTAIQIGLVNLLAQWDIYPAAVVGHSSGEIAAAYASGAMTANAAIITAYYRGHVTKVHGRTGGMAAVGIGREKVLQYLTEGVVIACENSDKSSTLSGDEDKLDLALEKIEVDMPDVFCRRLRVQVAYHSHHMQDLGSVYEALLLPHVTSKRPESNFYSTVSNKIISEPDALNAAYWRENMESPVLFNTAIKLILKEETETIFVEIGPHSALAGPLRQIFQAASTDPEPAYIPTLVRNKNQTTSLLTAAGQLYSQGVKVNFSAINGHGKVLTELPLYPWTHDTTYWSEPRLSRDWRLRKFAHHELLGSRVLETSDFEPAWRNLLRLENAPWLRDHKIVKDIVFPCAGYVATAGEAIRQITGSDDYTIRHLIVKTVMLLQESKATEITTSFKIVKLTDNLDSEWYEFSISSYNGTSWTKHCVGEIRPGSTEEHLNKTIIPFVRKVQSDRWYLVMKNFGLNYGSRFQGLKDISANPASDEATANVHDDRELYESIYSLHPTLIDQSLQLFTVAISRGLSSRLGQLVVPKSIGQLYISPGCPSVFLEATASIAEDGAVKGQGKATSNGRVVLCLQDGTFTPLDTDGSSKMSETVDIVRLTWRPDIDFVPAKNLMHSMSQKESFILVEQLTSLCIVETAQRLALLDSLSPHLKKFKSWIDNQTSISSRGEQGSFTEMQNGESMDSQTRLALIDTTTAQLDRTQLGPVGTLVRRVFDNCQEVFEGGTDALELLLKEDGLVELYNVMQQITDSVGFFSLCGHAKPALRVLEIGAGTGGMTSIILDALKSSEGMHMFSEYCFTDISPGFFGAARQRFREYQSIEFKVLDISKDPIDQGFESKGYDLIIASNVLHATPVLSSTLQNVRSLLAPGGRLFLQELFPTTRCINYIMGVLPGWWLGEQDQRHDEPYVSPERWDKELRGAGFTGADSVFYDEESPYQFNAHIVSTAVDATNANINQVTLLYNSEITLEARQIEEQFSQDGYIINWCSMNETPPDNQDVISLIDLEAPFFDNISHTEWNAFQHYLSNTGSIGTLWVTRPAQMSCTDPRYSLVLGVARTIRSELSVDLATCEMDRYDEHALKTLVKVYEKFRRQRKLGGPDTEYEYALCDGTVHIGRYYRVPAPEQVITTIEPGMAKSLDIGKGGALDTLTWRHVEMGKLTNDQVEISTRCVGLNFKDVIQAAGIIGGQKYSLGTEGSGVVCRIGSQVKDLSIGDRVMFTSAGSFSTQISISAELCIKIPDALSFEEAATMPCVFSTVIHSLVDMGRLEKGQSVLIHSACGGVGLAAIQICKMIGAEIYTTVGNEEKVQYLIDTYGIPRNRIYDSRSTSFLGNLKGETNGRGVDIVLNSLSGELLHASWQCVAEFGTMLEIGKRDFLGNSTLAMHAFLANRSFVGVDLADLMVQKPKAIQKLLKRLITYHQEGAIAPICPIQIFEAQRIVEPFRYMQKGLHMGKIVVKMPEDDEDLPAVDALDRFKLSPEASYLLIGGLGGLGRSIGTWMVENGACHLTYLSRSAGQSDSDKAFLEELKVQGCSITAVRGSVAVIDDVKHAVALCPRPVKGVIQMSMVLRDGPVLQMSHDDWAAALSPKVEGTWNLHRALETSKLDFFLLFSSISGSIGLSGQANYAAANTFLDSFVQYRHSLGLPASVIDVGVMEDVGYVSSNPALLQSLRATGIYMLQEKDLLDTVKIAMCHGQPHQAIEGPFFNPSQIAIGFGTSSSLSNPNKHGILVPNIRMSMLKNLEKHGTVSQGTGNQGLKGFISSLETNPVILDDRSSLDFIIQEIGNMVCSVMSQPKDDMDVTLLFSALGVDSLVSIEIRNWCRWNMGVEISVIEITNAGTIEQLGQVALDVLRTKHN